LLRIHLLQQWYDLSDPMMEDALIDVPASRLFAGIALISARIPDETTILAFRHASISSRKICRHVFFFA
jgi:IS5 family transposase